MMEIWKPTEYDNYVVSNLGRVKNNKTNKILKPQCTNGYHKIHIRKKNIAIHRLVAITFLPNIENKTQVNHIDGNKNNNALSNLEWTTQSENIRHGLSTGLYDNRFKRRRLTESFITDLMKEYAFGVKGKGVKALSKKYDLSEGTLRARIIKRLREESNGKPYQPTLELM